MAQEEHQRCSNSSSGGVRTSKKLKQRRKTPQRGLGVAQLEKIRLEEQQKKNSHRNHQSSPSIVFSPPSPTDLSSFRPSPPISPSNFDGLSPPPLLPPTTLLYSQNSCEPSDVGGSAIGASGSAAMAAGLGQGHGYLPTIWNSYEFNSNAEGSKLDPGLDFGQNLLNETNQIWPPVLIPRKQEHHHHQLLSSKVNLSMSIPQSSGLDLQMEPPSNQSYHSNYTIPLWSEEYKMVGMKRPWPFSLDNPPGPLLNFKFPPFLASTCGNGGSGTHSFEPEGSIFRDGPSSSTSFRHLDWRERLSELNSKKENGAIDTILTLGPSATTTTSSMISKAKQPLELRACHFHEFPEFNLLPFQGYTDKFFQQGGSIQQQPFYSFFPSKKHQMGTSAATTTEKRHETEGVDLTLKL